MKKWRKAMHYLDVHPVLPDDADDAQRKAYEDLWRPLLLNSALAALKSNDPERAVDYTERVLRRDISDADRGSFTCLKRSFRAQWD